MAVDEIVVGIDVFVQRQMQALERFEHQCKTFVQDQRMPINLSLEDWDEQFSAFYSIWDGK